MNAPAILDRLKGLGVSVSVAGGRLRLEPGSRVPSDVIEELRAHKPEIMAHLASGGHTHKLKYPDSLVASDSELREIEAAVQTDGVCLLYSTVLEDCIAFMKDESYLKDIPAGFTPYLDAELKRLFGGTDSPSVARLRLIHAAKKLGGGVVVKHDKELQGGEN